MLLLVAYVVFALGVSFMCSLLEAVILSISPSQVAQLEHEGKRTGQLLAEQKSELHKPLAAILTLNTIAHTIGAAGVGAQAQVLWGSEVLAVTSIVLTMLILFLSEIIPKTVGAAYCFRLAPLTVRVLQVLVWLFAPFVWMSEAITGRVRLDEEEEVVDRRQIAALASLAHEGGALEASEAKLITNIMGAGEVKIRDIMTPRTVLFTLPEAADISEAMSERLFPRFSRIPVWKETEDDISGYVLKDELLQQAANGAADKLVREFLRPLLILPESQHVVEAFQRMLEGREHIAVVVDEYGSVAGVTTMEDILETILGCEIVDEADGVRDMRLLARRRWLERAKRLGIRADATNPGHRAGNSTHSDVHS